MVAISSRASPNPKNLDTVYSLNGLGNLTEQVSPDTGSSQRTYDNAGNLKSSTDARGIKTNYTYDALNRIIKITYGGDPRTEFTYDSTPNAIGKRTRMLDASVDTLWDYDTQGRVAAKRQLQNSHTFSVGYGYDAGGRLQSLVYPSGNRVSYSYDSGGRLKSLSVQGTASKALYTVDQYEPFGGPRHITYGNGQIRVQSYDLDGRLIAYTRSTDYRILTYDEAGRITKISPTDPAQAQLYSYDNNDPP